MGISHQLSVQTDSSVVLLLRSGVCAGSSLAHSSLAETLTVSAPRHQRDT
jgi:hypothetical protein